MSELNIVKFANENYGIRCTLEGGKYKFVDNGMELRPRNNRANQEYKTLQQARGVMRTYIAGHESALDMGEIVDLSQQSNNRGGNGKNS